jgi:hypothetical protein
MGAVDEGLGQVELATITQVLGDRAKAASCDRVKTGQS